MTDNIEVESMKIDKTGVQLQFRHPAFAFWVQDMLEMFDESGAINYLDLTAETTDRGKFVVSIQRQEGKTAGQLNHELKETLAMLQKKHDMIKNVVKESRGLVENNAALNMFSAEIGGILEMEF